MELVANCADHAFVILQVGVGHFEHFFDDGLRGDLECKGVEKDGLPDVW